MFKFLFGLTLGSILGFFAAFLALIVGIVALEDMDPEARAKMFGNKD